MWAGWALCSTCTHSHGLATPMQLPALVCCPADVYLHVWEPAGVSGAAVMPTVNASWASLDVCCSLPIHLGQECSRRLV